MAKKRKTNQPKDKFADALAQRGENKVRILDVGISTLSQDQIREKICQFLRGKKQHQVVTPNPEFLLTAMTDEHFHYILEHASLAVPDGIGLKFAAWLRGRNIYRLAGSDLVLDILACAQEYELSVAILNYSASLSQNKTLDKKLRQRYPHLKFLIHSVDRQPFNYNLSALKKFAPTVLLCTLGAPYQDKLIWELLPQLPSARLGMGVGGSFDFLTKALRRAPQLFRWLGLEWLWRLFLEPVKRSKRIYRAVIVFAWQAFKTTYLNRFFYRKNVVGFIFNQQQEVLLLNSNKTLEDYWKMPQGGVDPGENYQQAIKREMTEEIGNNHFTILACYKNIFKYKWNYNYGIMGYKGQKQTLYILKYTGQPQDIRLSLEHKGLKWVPITRLIQEADPITEQAYELFLQKYHQTMTKNHLLNNI